MSLRLTPDLPDTGAFCKNGANQHSHRPRRDPDESKSLKTGRDPGWVGWQSAGKDNFLTMILVKSTEKEAVV